MAVEFNHRNANLIYVRILNRTIIFSGFDSIMLI